MAPTFPAKYTHPTKLTHCNCFISRSRSFRSTITPSSAAMVVALGPGKFYGSSLPRPRFFANDHRVDPPPSVTDPLISWAEEAHWSMGGLSLKRRRLQGRIEGDVERLRAQRDQICKKTPKQHRPVKAVGAVVEETNRGAARRSGNVFEMDCSSAGEIGGAAADVGGGEGEVKKRRKLVKGGRKIGST